MANLKKNVVEVIHWREGMRARGKFTMPVNDYGEYLMRSGKNKQNSRKRKHLAKAFS
jgi:hypothetical protein